MFGLGTIVNTIAVVAGGIIGLLFKNGLKNRYQETIMQGIGLAVLFVGISHQMFSDFSGFDCRHHILRRVLCCMREAHAARVSSIHFLSFPMSEKQFYSFSMLQTASSIV